MREQLSLIITLISRGEGHELPRFWQINYPYSNEGAGAGVDYANHITYYCHLPSPQIFGPSTPSAGCRIVMRFSQFKLGCSYVGYRILNKGKRARK